MNRYEEYKNSGVQWIGEIPSHWEVVPLFSIANNFEKGQGITKEQIYEDGDIQCVRYGEVYTQYNISFSTCISKTRLSEISNPTFFSKGDVLFTTTGELVDEIGKSIVYMGNDDCLAGGDTVVMKHSQNPKFLGYCLSSHPVQRQKSFGKAKLKVVHTSINSLRRVSLPLPPLPEQQAIVTYLDEKVGKIDACIEARKKEIGLLNESKKAIIADAVTHGLNPDAEMKDSGIPWIDQIPAHWEVIRMKGLFEESDEKSETGTEELLSLSQYTGIKRKSDCEKTGMFEAESTVGYKIVHKGQFVMNIMLAWNGSYAVSDYEGIISPAYCVFNFRRVCNKKYYDFLLRIQAYSGAFKTESRGIIDSRLRLYPYKFYSFPVLVPPIEDQNQIVDAIEKRVSNIDIVIEKMQGQIEGLKEYKQRLISDVVTGQKKIIKNPMSRKR